jgi:hypothetical protein
VTFLQWTFLVGAVAVAGPIVAHLLGKPRFRRVPFTMLQFLRRGQSQRYSRRQLRDLLILLLRCTIIILIAVLFAQPLLYVRAEPAKHRSVHWLALDDSMSMAYRDGSQTLFDRMIGMSLDYVRRTPEDATFTICGLASGRMSHGLTKAQALAQIRQVKPVPAGVSFAELFSTLKQARKTAPQGQMLSLLLLSDFTPSILQALERVPAPAAVDAVQYEHVGPREAAGNTAVLGARVAAIHDRKLSLDVTVCHYGVTERQCTVTAAGNANLPIGPPVGARHASPLPNAVSEVTLAPGQLRVLRLEMELGSVRQGLNETCWPIELHLTPDDNLGADDTYRLAVSVPSDAARTSIAVVHQEDETFLFETALQALSNSGTLAGLSLKKVPEDRLTGSDLAGADIVVFASVPALADYQVAALKAVVQQGGRLVFFTNDVPRSEAVQSLWREGLLPALPQRWVAQTIYPEPRPAVGTSLDLDSRAAKSLVNYSIDKIALKGHWQCEPAAQAECLWRLAGGAPFLYGLAVGPGLSLLVNTSIDGSLGLLAKSPAWVAFCRYLVGREEPARQFCFAADEQPVLHVPFYPAKAGTPNTTVAVENCDGSRGTAAVRGSRVFLPAPAGLGWMKTIDEPVVYVGINLPAGETDTGAPADGAIADAVRRAFITDTREDPVLAQVGATHASGSQTRNYAFGVPSPVLRQEPLWRYFAWAAILLLLLDAAVTNRLRR